VDESERTQAFLAALIAEHSVLQAASSATFADAGARSSLYVFSLSSSLVAMGFAAQSPGAFVPFAATVLPAVFILGLFTIVRLVDSTIENMQYLDGIARIRAQYRKLSPEAAAFFTPETGRWPEVWTSPSLQLGALAGFLTTTASMVALINGIVAGAGVTLFAHRALGGGRLGLAVGIGAAAFGLLMAAFLVFQRWRFSSLELLTKPDGGQ
jgi:hypothetical protein